jgi:hypothetical protein
MIARWQVDKGCSVLQNIGNESAMFFRSIDTYRFFGELFRRIGWDIDVFAMGFLTKSEFDIYCWE